MSVEAHAELAQSYSYRYLKRLIDVGVSLVALVLLFPLLLAIGVVAKLASPGPVFYRWPVVGQDGRPIRAFKFRTMHVGADTLKNSLLDRNEATGSIFKMRNDPRVTSLGRFLRQFSLDELPQLWTVLRGEMSIVGPRPVLTFEWE